MATKVFIGNGANGRVYYDVKTGYCFKKSRVDTCDLTQEAELQMIAAKHGLAPQVNSYTKDYIEMEYIDGETVCSFVEKNGPSEDLIDEMNKYVKTLKNIGIEYPDDHDENFLVDKNGKLWVIDFGSAYYSKI